MLSLDKERQDLLAQLWDALVQALLDRIQSGDATAGDLSVARHVCKDAGLRFPDGRVLQSVSHCLHQ